MVPEEQLSRIEATKRQIETFEGAIAAWHASKRPSKIHPTLWKALLRAYRSQRAELYEELRLLQRGEF